ncbi:MAG: D-2-hydroxyacid dehydrogenase [Thermomicrobiales bacterium]|nr:D-2-hydroxyacid dehydrogenase [Thermomicrobiales bacterium]
MPIDQLTIICSIDLPERFARMITEADPDVDLRIVPRGELGDHLADADVLIGWAAESRHLDAAPKLRWIQTPTAGVDGVDRAAIKARGILLTNSSGVHAVNIPEHILGYMLAFSRQFHRAFEQQQRHEWNGDAIRPHTFELMGSTLLVAGLGHIGEGLAVRAKALGMRVIGMRRRLTIERASAADEVIGFGDLKSRIGEADHVAITLPLTADTEGMFDAGVIAAMKPGAYLYNIGRGSIIDQDALIAALETGHLAGAGLDVTTPEPLPADSPLWTAPNVIITPHTSGWSPKNLDRGVPLWIENLRRFRANEPLVNLIDLDAGY